MSQLHFELRPSLTKLGLMVGLFILLNGILSNYLGGIFFGITMLACLMALYFVHDRNPLQKLAHLDAQTWVLQFKDQRQWQAELISVQAMGRCIFLKFEDDSHKKYQCCITKEQLVLEEWQQLKTLVELN